MSNQPLRLLSLDGGGVRGLASLQVLKRLLAKVGGPKPCEFFHMICGTSTGGLIAIMLGKLEMTIDACIVAFSQMMATVFVRKRKSPFSFKGKVKARYDTAPLENCIKQVIANAGQAGARMRSGGDPACKVVVVAMDKLTSRSVYFTNYEKPGQEKVFDTITILDAALATTAATSFFDDKIITNDGITRTFGDAAIGENNPINGLWTEAIEQYGRDLEKKIRCLLSLGTGVPQLSQFGDDLKSVAESIIEIAKATEVTGDRFRNSNGLAGRGVYYRFSPPDIYTIRMDAAKMSGHIEALTAPYLETEETQGKIARFEQANQPEHRVEATPRLEIQPVPTKLFTTLEDNPKNIQRNAMYWRHLTVRAYDIYERIYLACKPTRNAVGFSAFLDQFQQYNRYSPEPRKIEEVWSRLLRDADMPSAHVQQSSHPKGFVMATIYMLHIETSIHSKHERPIMDNGQEGVDMRRREALKRFAKWVPCRCSSDCGKEWNFVNEIGLSRPEGDDDKCGIAKLLGRGPIRNLVASKNLKALEDTRKFWYMATL